LVNTDKFWQKEPSSDS